MSKQYFISMMIPNTEISFFFIYIYGKGGAEKRLSAYCANVNTQVQIPSTQANTWWSHQPQAI